MRRTVAPEHGESLWPTVTSRPPGNRASFRPYRRAGRKNHGSKDGRARRSDPYTRPLGSMKWTYFQLYVVLEISSRYAVGWMVADRENSALAARLIEETCH